MGEALKELLTNWPGAIALIAVCIPVTGIIAHYWSETARNRDNNRLKQSMVERGMSAEDIERVIKAGADQEDEEE